MDKNNQTFVSEFLLLGLAGYPKTEIIYFVIVLVMYLVILTGNGVLIIASIFDSRLHTPMYFFLGNLSFLDICYTTSSVPSTLVSLISKKRNISFSGCAVQMFFGFAMGSTECLLLGMMAFDRYVAICKPLHYMRILTRHVMLGISVTITVRAVIFMTPLSWMLSHLPFCASNVVPHSYCEHMAVAKLACADPMPSSLYSLIFSSIIVGSDVAFISASYSLILKAVFGLSSRNAQWKALSTCGSHVGVMALYYLPGMASIYVAWLGQDRVPLHTQVLLADLYLIIPPTLNPIIYGIRTRQIRERIWSLLTHCFFSQCTQGS